MLARTPESLIAIRAPRYFLSYLHLQNRDGGIRTRDPLNPIRTDHGPRSGRKSEAPSSPTHRKWRTGGVSERRHRITMSEDAGSNVGQDREKQTPKQTPGGPRRRADGTDPETEGRPEQHSTPRPDREGTTARQGIGLPSSTW